MHDMSTFAGQAEHYAAVRARLRGAPPPKPTPVVVAPPPAPVAPTEQAIQDAESISALKAGAPRWKRILHEVAEKHGLGVMDLISSSRSRNVVFARQEAIFRLRMETSLSLPQIGRRLGGKDHTTVLHSIKRYLHRNGETETAGKIKRWPVWGKGGWH